MDYKTFFKLLETNQNDKIKLLFGGDFVARYSCALDIYFEKAIETNNFEIASWLIEKGIEISPKSIIFMKLNFPEKYLNFERHQKLSQSCFTA
jgi:hypothetical protein